ncbi:MAG: hypothetical protein AB8I08_37545 [Sandaracinaceae bacterium]
MRQLVRHWTGVFALAAAMCLPAHAGAQDGPGAPATDTPTVDAPAADPPTTDAPAAGTPAVGAPAVDAPAVDAPAVDAPAAVPPAAGTPAVDAPAADAPVADAPTTDTPAPEEAPAADASTGDGGQRVGDAGVPEESPATGAAQDIDPSELPEGHVPEITLRIDDEGVQTGDLVDVEITAVMPEGDDVTLPEQDLGDLEIHDRSFVDVMEGGRRTLTFRLELLALAPGEVDLPALRLRVVTADGDVGTVETEPRTIHVGSRVGNEPDAQPRPPTQPVTVTQEDYTLAWVMGIFAALLLTALLAFLVGRWWRRRPKKAAPPPPPRPPWEVALEQLGVLEREKEALLAEGRQMDFVDRVSDVVRNYLGLRYDFNGLESTSDEVIGRLRKIKLRRIALDDVRSLLADSDLVKFARAEPDEQQCDRMLKGAVAIVRGTAPQPGELARATPSSAPKKKTKKKRPKATGGAVVTKRGVTLPLSVRTIDEAQHEIGAVVGAAARDHVGAEGFGGTLLVVLGPELAPNPDVDEALQRVHQQLTAELATVPMHASGTAVLVIEHYHRRLADAAAVGEAARVSVIDDRGIRHAKRRPAGTSKRVKSVASESLSGATTASEATSRPAPSGEQAPRARTSSEDAGSNEDAATLDTAALDTATLDTATLDTATFSSDTPLAASAGSMGASHDAAHTSAEHTSAEHTSAKHTSAEHTSAEHTSAEDTSAEHTSAEDTGAEHTGAEHTGAEHTRAEHTGAEHTRAAGTREEDVLSSDDVATEADEIGALASGEAREIEEARRELRRRHEAKQTPSMPPAAEESTASQTARFRLIETAFPEAAERVRPVFAPKGSTEGEPVLRWVTGIEHAIGYEVDDGLIAPPALRGMKLSRGQLHTRALDNLRGVIPDGFAPGAHPAYLDGGETALLLLPELVPSGESWLAYPTHEGELIVMREGAASTDTELTRLHNERHAEDPLHRPVRVRRRGFEPVPWPSDARPTTPDSPLLPARGAKTMQGHDFANAVKAAKSEEEDA